jgi:hypothetical protein
MLPGDAEMSHVPYMYIYMGSGGQQAEIDTQQPWNGRC